MNMDVTSILISIAIGAVSGWLAGILMNSRGSLLRNIILGIIGGFFGTWVFSYFGIFFAGYVGTIIVSVAGACIVLYAAKLLLGKRR